MGGTTYGYVCFEYNLPWSLPLALSCGIPGQTNSAMCVPHQFGLAKM